MRRRRKSLWRSWRMKSGRRKRKRMAEDRRTRRRGEGEGEEEVVQE